MTEAKEAQTNSVPPSSGRLLETEATRRRVDPPPDLVVDQQLHRGHGGLGVALLLIPAAVLRRQVGGLQQSVLNEDGQRSQDEGGKQVHVDVVPHAVQFPETKCVFYPSETQSVTTEG